ncbi:MAG: peptidoglycan editing factor PgeF [Burkholderiales bacterium]
MFDWISPDWPAPENVRALITTRKGGRSCGAFASMNLGNGLGDTHVGENRALLRAHVPAEPVWLRQVHGIRVADAGATNDTAEADASFTCAPGVVCVALTADCLPVLLCNREGTIVAAVHAGWRGLAGGILERAVADIRTETTDVIAYLGPAIGPQAYEVGAEVRRAFTDMHQEAEAAFTPHGEKWLADLYLLARLRLASVGITRVFGESLCTYSDADRFFSHRRDGTTGRMASLIWLDTP